MIRFIVRYLNIVFGLFLFAFGVVTAIKANVGYAPWEVLHVGLSITAGITVGTAAIAVGAVIVAIAAVSREKIGLGTITHTILTGVYIDVIMNLNIIPAAPNFAVGVLMLAPAMFFMSFGTFFFMRAAFGSGPRDSLMVALTRRTKFPVGVCRSALELTATVVGYFLGGMVGLGTVISAFGIGFCIQITFKFLKFDPTSVKHESIVDTFAVFFKKKHEQ